MSFPRFLVYSITFAFINSVVLAVVGFIAFGLLTQAVSESVAKSLESQRPELPWGVPPGYRKAGEELTRDLDKATNFDLTPKRGVSPR